jgi:hypothetical protein
MIPRKYLYLVALARKTHFGGAAAPGRYSHHDKTAHMHLRGDIQFDGILLEAHAGTDSAVINFANGTVS